MASGSIQPRGATRRVPVIALTVPLVLAIAVGCSGPKVRNAPPAAIATKPWANRDSSDTYQDADTITVSGLSAALQGTDPGRPADKPLNILCVSGGGKYAAFTAGALSGWTAAGTRPTFDIATGVSSGAPTAVLGFLGSKYDRLLSETFVNLRRSDVFHWRPVRGLVTGSGLMTARPLEDIFEKQLTDDLLADLRAAHADGRRLFIATSNVLTRRLVIWDLGAIASSGRPDAAVLVRKVLLASCSIPALVPPVQFDVTVNGVRYTELHADAGGTAQTFVRTAGPVPPGSSVWLLSSGKSYPDGGTTRPRIWSAMFHAVSSALYSLFRADTVKLFTFCTATKSQFHLLALPENFKGKASSIVFDPSESQRMYMVGYQLAVAGAWQTRPPETGPGEAPPPRAGFDFVTPE
ncbi:hypothetical protein FTUN_1886 [Frigoriglobus tundricola]|uniref:PNPLA domain-containing protein n=1 Tax=Frigoriglobus tundricola TaxID=2774151 RepID=A0A6M5YM09_9BACT|nr:hypothetical protein FTUN_1886 [Frigoriglobus tundricola]